MFEEVEKTNSDIANKFSLSLFIFFVSHSRLPFLQAKGIKNNYQKLLEIEKEIVREVALRG